MGRFSKSLAVCAVVLPAVSTALVACGDDTTGSEATSSSTSGDASTSTGAGSPTAGSTTNATSGGGEGGEGPATTSAQGGGGAGGTGGSGGDGGGVPCRSAAECDDDNACTADACDGGFCVNTAAEDGTPIDADGNPCTDDECLGGAETHTDKPAGALPSDEDGGCAGVCQAAPFGGQCGLSLYRKAYPGGDDVWTRDALSSIWTGADAPPPSDVIEAEQTFGQDRLMVWAADGTFYQRFDGVWSAPTPATDVFEGLDAGDLVALTVAHKPTFGVDDETLTITTNDASPQQLHYTLIADGTILYASGPDPIGNAQLGDPEAPPQHTTPYDWGFARQTAEPFQAEGWLHFDEALGGSIYDLDGSSGSFDFIGSDPEADSDLFAGDGGPAPGTVVAAYYDGQTQQVFLVAP